MATGIGMDANFSALQTGIAGIGTTSMDKMIAAAPPEQRPFLIAQKEAQMGQLVTDTVKSMIKSYFDSGDGVARDGFA